MRLLLYLALVMVSSVPSQAAHTVHVTGTVANIQGWEIKGYYTAMVVNAVGIPRPGSVWTSPQVTVDLKTGHFEGEIACEVVRNVSGRWVDIHLVNAAVTFQVYSEMVIRAPYAKDIDLGTFDWKPSHYRWKEGALVLDTAVPRDTVIGDLFNDHVRISPINPEPGDTMRFEFVWNNSGQPLQAGMGGFYMKDCCTVLCDFTFAVRTDTDVFTASWPHRVGLHLLAETKGRYHLRQIPAQGEHLRDIDFLLGEDLYFNVGKRDDP